MLSVGRPAEKGRIPDRFYTIIILPCARKPPAARPPAAEEFTRSVCGGFLAWRRPGGGVMAARWQPVTRVEHVPYRKSGSCSLKQKYDSIQERKRLKDAKYVINKVMSTFSDLGS